MKKNPNSITMLYVIVAIILTTAVIIYISMGGRLNDLQWNENPGEIAGELLIKVTIIAALLDQILFLVFPDNSDVLNKAYSKIKACKREKDLDSVDNSEVFRKMRKAEMKITEENKKRLRIVQLAAFGIALFLSISGVRILSEFIELNNSSMNDNKFFLTFDVISTAALLSGGTSAVEMFFQIIRKNIRTRS